MTLESVILENYRCFHEEQTARLAPLTLLVGENSTGKSSFLALLRALWDVTFREVAPDFREPPYDLGSFEDIVHDGSSRREANELFKAGFECRIAQLNGRKLQFRYAFKERQAIPFPVLRRLTADREWIEADLEKSEKPVLRFGTGTQQWERYPDTSLMSSFNTPNSSQMTSLFHLFVVSNINRDSEKLNDEVWNRLMHLAGVASQAYRGHSSYAGAPVRSRPRRTYDPARPYRDPEGENIPSYLANMSRQNVSEWRTLKTNLEEFGRDSGLFDEIHIDSLGNTTGSPFQVQISKRLRNTKGNRRNLIDVGYGVSQALPVITELLNPEPPPLFLLQQPEVHLHPSAQASLGSLFCSIASRDRQLVVETHSDFILDRILLDIRDKKTNLTADDVSILYFEPNDLDVTIHSLRIDDRATIIDPPDSYRRFFMDELRRSVGL